MQKPAGNTTALWRQQWAGGEEEGLQELLLHFSVLCGVTEGVDIELQDIVQWCESRW